VVVVVVRYREQCDRTGGGSGCGAISGTVRQKWWWWLWCDIGNSATEMVVVVVVPYRIVS